MTFFPLSDSGVQSHEKDAEGRPLLQLCPPTVNVRSFGQLCKLVHLAADKKLDELRACLEGKAQWPQLEVRDSIYIQPQTYLHNHQT